MARAAAASLLLLLAAGGAAALLLERPAGDCLSPALSTLAAHNLFPKAYQLRSIRPAGASPSQSGFATAVRARHEAGRRRLIWAPCSQKCATRPPHGPLSAAGAPGAQVDFAQDFAVAYHGTYKVVTNKRVNETYVLYQCGTPNPVRVEATEGLPPGAKVFEIPLVSVAVTDSNAAGFLAELGLVDRVAAASQYSFNPCLQAIHACGAEAVPASAPADYDASPDNDAEHGAAVAAWRAAAGAQDARVDAVFGAEASPNPKSIAVTAFADPGALNRAEWVKYVALFFNKEVEAEALFSAVARDYDALASAARRAGGGEGAGAARRRTVAWLSKQGDSVSVDYSPYKVELMTDAGGAVLPAADAAAAGGEEVRGAYSTRSYAFNASAPAQRAALVKLLGQVDVLFDDSYAPRSSNLADLPAFRTAYGLSAAEAASIPAVAAGQVWSFNGRLAAPAADGSAASDWFEGSVARPDLVLADFVAAITPAALPAGGAAAPAWLRRLPAAPDANGLPAVGADLCTALPSGAGAPGACERAAPARICPNAYRDCATGELRAVSDPGARCEAATACPDAAAGAAAGTRNGGGARAGGAGAARALLAGLAGAGLAALAL
ncbi:hypothetical protein HT031_004775 [Scenedesmus sp. PABB004]|nr:hypothetical protein HT031_004775 [Scenedesmus sp. PABB004]